MSKVRTRAFMGLALAVLAATADPARAQSGSPDATPPIDGRAVLTPRILLFGDTLRAHVDLVVDPSRVDPGTVRVAASFTPWTTLGAPERSRRDVGGTTYLRTTYVLRCLTGPCAPSSQASPLEFDLVRIRFANTAGDRGSIRLSWPVLTVYSRFAAARFDGLADTAVTWRADVHTLPAASYRATPGLLLALLLGGGGVLTVGGAALAYMARPRRSPAPPPEPEPPPAVRLTPLQQALVLLEDAARTDGAENRRRSLELVADVLAEWGDDDLARAARVLAWSEHEPAVEDTAGLAARVRSTLEAELAAQLADEEGNGRVE